MPSFDAQTGRPDCFGDLDEVFPQSDEGLRETPPHCWDCSLRVDCLRQAISGGESRRQISEESAQREEQMVGGVAGFLRRWSRLKQEKP